MKKLRGIHHVTAITSSAEKIYDFFTYVLGMRLVKKTVNQDDIDTYHLFFADDEGNPGTDMTFFDFKGIGKARRGTNEISRTGFRVPSDEALTYWLKRFEHYQVKHEMIREEFGRKVIYFEDFDEQYYALVSDENDQGIASGVPWKKGPVPDEYAITGLGPIYFTVKSLNDIETILVNNLFMRKETEHEGQVLYEMGEGGNGARVIVREDAENPVQLQGFGSVHHVAFRIEDRQELEAWIDHFNTLGVAHSGYVDRFYFKSLYTRMHRGLLFELATEGPGFIDDEEDYEHLGERLALPPNYRKHREYIESVVRPIDTVRSTKQFKKEYF